MKTNHPLSVAIESDNGTNQASVRYEEYKSKINQEDEFIVRTYTLFWVKLGYGLFQRVSAAQEGITMQKISIS